MHPVMATIMRQMEINIIKLAGVKKWSSIKMSKSSKIVEIVEPTARSRNAVSCK